MEGEGWNLFWRLSLPQSHHVDLPRLGSCFSPYGDPFWLLQTAPPSTGLQIRCSFGNFWRLTGGLLGVGEGRNRLKMEVHKPVLASWPLAQHPKGSHGQSSCPTKPPALRSKDGDSCALRSVSLLGQPGVPQRSASRSRSVALRGSWWMSPTQSRQGVERRLPRPGGLCHIP